MRLAVRQARCLRDDLTRALSKLSEIDGRDLAAFLEKGGYDGLGVQFGPPFVPVLFLYFVPACHGNTKMFPRASSLYNEVWSARFLLTVQG
jgi:hypothetical protein